ncbi:MAG TPA: DUF4838 domain-containing protein [Candidatus Brocadiia bacterium]|nr:DUF4838 domain-containing protein [Candidatus Brocadiia bacterium]
MTAILAAAAVAAPLVRDGQPAAAVVLPAAPQEQEKLAAQELVEHVRLISGATLPVVEGKEAPKDLAPILLGGAASPSLDTATRQKGDNPSSFALVVDAASVSIRGLSAEGTLFGVYDLLEQLGVRWYMPGDLGRVLPSAKTLDAPAQQTFQAPSFSFRQLQHIQWGDWPRRARMGGLVRSTGGHGIPPFGGGAGRDNLFAEHPEYFALINGKRQKRQLCLSNPDVFKLALAACRERLRAGLPRQQLGLGPDDGGGYCECAGCRALDGGVHDPLCGAESMTDRYVWFVNKLIEALEPEFPDVHIAMYVYAQHMMPPAKVKPNKRFVAVFAPITLDRIRGMDNPMSPDRHILRWIIDRWSEFGLDEMYYRGYYNNLACPQFPISYVDRVRHETPAFRKAGLTAMRVEVILPSWSIDNPYLYLATRLMWNVDTGVDALLNEFYAKFYGPASQPMKTYYEAIDAAFRDTPFCSGGAYVYFPIFTPERRAALRALLDQAARLAGGQDTLFAQRVHAVRLGFDRMELFLDMIAARNDFDFVKARRKAQEFMALSDLMVAQVLEKPADAKERSWARLLDFNERSDNPRSYFHRFWSPTVMSGYERLAQAGEMAAGLPDAWDFMLDTAGLGEMGGWHRDGVLGGNWQRILTKTRTWSDQGLHYYRGTAWYRSTAVIPEKFRGRKIYLWFGGVDRTATVWVNGKLLGTSAEPNEGLPGVPGAFRPFDLDATKAVRFGAAQPNTIAVRVDSPTLSEVGTGGIVAPVMFWSPKDPNWKPKR